MQTTASDNSPPLALTFQRRRLPKPRPNLRRSMTTIAPPWLQILFCLLALSPLFGDPNATAQMRFKQSATQPTDPALRQSQAKTPADHFPTLDISRPLLDDATLRSVHFVDPDQGWAVGDYGVILHTKDGGTNWIHQDSGVRCRLLDIDFRTPQFGIAVGGWYETDTGMSRGVVLRTNDGGETWTQLRGELPMLRQVWLRKDGAMIVAGDWSTTYQGRVLFSQDRGVNWTSIEGQTIERAELVAVDNSSDRSDNSDSIYIVDQQGILHRVDRLESPPVAVSVVGKAESISIRNRRIVVGLRSDNAEKSNSLQSPNIIAKSSTDGGRTWADITVSSNNLSTSVSGQPSGFGQPSVSSQPSGFGQTGNLRQHQQGFELSGGMSTSFMIADGTTWLTGVPGTKVIRIMPDGTSTESHTGNHLPIHDMFFLDNFRGWAVGAFGTVLASRDGGQTWRSQRQFERGSEAEQGRRAMVLGIANRAIHLPWSVLASQSLESGHRVAMAISDQAESSNPLFGSPIERCRDAATRVGCGEVVVWDIDRVNQVLTSYRPSVVVLAADLTEDQRRQWLDSAISANVARVFQVDNGSRPDVTLPSSAVLPGAAAIRSDLWAAAQEIIQPHQPIGSSLNLKCRWDQSQADNWRSGVADGLSNLGAIREFVDGRRRNVPVLQARSLEQGLVDRLFLSANDSGAEAVEEKLTLLIKQTPVTNRHALVRSILQRCVRDGSKSSLKLFVVGLTFAAEQFPDAPLGQWARLRYETIRTSSEWQSILDDPSLWRKPKNNVRPTDGNTVPAYASPFERTDTESGLSMHSPIALPNTYQTPGGPIQSPISQTGASLENEMIPSLSTSEMDLFYRLNPAVLAWKSKFDDETFDGFEKAIMQRLVDSPSSGSWRAFMSPTAVRPIFAPSVAGMNVSSGQSRRPLLDGVLDEDCWNVSIVDMASYPRSEVDWGFDSQTTKQSLPANQARELQDLRFAYDGEFLYLGVREKFAEDDVDRMPQRRTRDADTAGNGRVIIELDIDRDMWTAYELTVDQAGQTRDTCDGFQDWQPRWYVASKVEAGIRTVEAAIRREDLTRMPPVRGERWRIRGRFVPAGEEDSRQSVPSPDGWRDLLFE